MPSMNPGPILSLVLKSLGAGQRMTTAQIAREHGVDVRAVRKCMNRMVETKRMRIAKGNAYPPLYELVPGAIVILKPPPPAITSVQHAIATQPKSIFDVARL